MQKISIGVMLVLISLFAGCDGGNKVTLPTDKLTAEQEAKVKIEDQNVADEESQGKNKAKKK